MFRGWGVLAGTEIFNNTRTLTYARKMGLGWLKPSAVAEQLPLMLGDGDQYKTPLLDDAPWVDPNDPASFEFLGFYCLSVTGLEDSSREAPITEYLVDGGSVGAIRHATKSFVVNGALVALSDAGAEYGMRWLRQATLDGPCVNGGLFGGDFCYLAAEPQLDAPSDAATLAWLDGGTPDADAGVIVDEGDPDDEGDLYEGGDPDTPTPIIEHSTGIFEVPDPVDWDPTECLTPYVRTLRKVKVPGGPSLVQEYAVRRGALWGVQFTAVAGVPWTFAAEVDVVSDFMGDETSGVATDIDSIGSQFVDTDDCNEAIWGPMVDPLCPVIVAPPAPVNVALGCSDVPTVWKRRQFSIPAFVVPVWSDMAPIITIRSRPTEDLRNLRLRFYSDPFELADTSTDPCSFCGDLLVSYLPQNATMTIDAASESVYVTLPGGIVRRADGLVYGADGKPFSWPTLTCGIGYVVTIDLPMTADTPTMDLALLPKAR